MKKTLLPLLHKHTVQVALLLVLLLSSHSLQAQLDPDQNNPMPKHIAVDIADLLVLEDPAVIPNDTTHFAVKAHLYNSLLNLLATRKATFKILYTDKISPYINYSQDEAGVYHYEVVPGQEDALLGYSSCLNATKFRDILCKDQAENFTIDANVDSNSDTYVWVYLNATYSSLATDLAAAGYQHYQWIGATGEGDYYDLYSTQYDNRRGGFDNSLSGGIWVGIKCNEPATRDWTVTGNKNDGLTTITDGAKAKVQEPAVVSPVAFDVSTLQLLKADTDMDRTWSQWWGQLTNFDKIAAVTFVPAILLTCAVCTPEGLLALEINNSTAFWMKSFLILWAHDGFRALTIPKPPSSTN